jgi:hypothetical protein
MRKTKELSKKDIETITSWITADGDNSIESCLDELENTEDYRRKAEQRHELYLTPAQLLSEACWLGLELECVNKKREVSTQEAEEILKTWKESIQKGEWR